VTPDGKYVVVGSPEAKKATVFDLKAPGFPKAWEVEFDQRVMPIAIESDSHGAGRRIFLQLDRTNGFVVVDFLTHKEVARIKYPAEYQTLDLGVRAPSHGIAVSPDGKVVVCNSHASNSVFFYSIPDYKLLGRVALASEKIPGKNLIGAMPEWIDFTPDGKLVYVSNSSFDNVSAIDVKTMKEVARIPVGEEPKRLSVLELR
jgi:YVTN family beta-propeller protein